MSLQSAFQEAVDGRHPSVQQVCSFFDYEHLPEHLQFVSAIFTEAAAQLLCMVSDGPELTVAFRKLLEAKDCAVRQAVFDHHLSTCL